MSIPSITQINPSAGPTGGGLLIEVRGGGFREPAPPAQTGPTTPPVPTVRVMIGGRLALDVRVFAADRLTCLVPSGDAGPRDLLVQNLDDDGAPIAEQQATAAEAFVYARPDLAVEADLTRLVRMLLQELKRQVLENVVLTVHTDFDDESGAELHLAHIAQLPGLVLVGPELGEDRFLSLNQLPEAAEAGDRFALRRAPYTVDLSFSIVGVATHTTELLNLAAATQLFFHKNKYLEMDRDADDPGAGTARYEMDIARDGAPKVTGAPNESNIRSFSGRFVIRGFDLENLAGFPNEGVVERGAISSDVSLQPPEPLRLSAPGSGKP